LLGKGLVVSRPRLVDKGVSEYVFFLWVREKGNWGRFEANMVQFLFRIEKSELGIVGLIGWMF
jgi:hypothetical protein